MSSPHLFGRALTAIVTALVTFASALVTFASAPVDAQAGTVRSTTDDSDQLLHACPIIGPASFEDSWGWARSGGRRHEGVDMIAERGTPVAAVSDGEVSFSTSRLGGRSAWLVTDTGDRFFYAHLDRWEGERRVVDAGDVIGYVGSTGNARGPHLHFEVHPDGNVENPFPHTFIACVPDLSGPTINHVARAMSSAAIDARLTASGISRAR